jgi:hypothetical protein
MVARREGDLVDLQQHAQRAVGGIISCKGVGHAVSFKIG